MVTQRGRVVNVLTVVLVVLSVSVSQMAVRVSPCWQCHRTASPCPWPPSSQVHAAGQAPRVLQAFSKEVFGSLQTETLLNCWPFEILYLVAQVADTISRKSVPKLFNSHEHFQKPVVYILGVGSFFFCFFVFILSWNVPHFSHIILAGNNVLWPKLPHDYWNRPLSI